VRLRTHALICAAGWLALLAAPAGAADDAALLEDLGSAIALLDLPCGQVVSATRLKDNDHVARCGDGRRYHVFISAEGRVTARELQPWRPRAPPRRDER
jgi:hypothetical protein